MKNITYTQDVALVILKNCSSDARFFASVLSEIAKLGVDVDMISQTSPSGGFIDLCFTVTDSDVPKLLRLTAMLKKQQPSVIAKINGNNCKISVSDEDMHRQPGYAADIFNKIASVNAEIRLVTTSETDISVLVVNDYADAILSALK